MTEEAVQKFVNALISGQVALHYFEELKHTPFYRHQFKQKLNRVIKNAATVLQAYQKEPKRLEGLVIKILQK